MSCWIKVKKTSFINSIANIQRWLKRRGDSIFVTVIIQRGYYRNTLFVFGTDGTDYAWNAIDQNFWLVKFFSHVKGKKKDTTLLIYAVLYILFFFWTFKKKNHLSLLQIKELYWNIFEWMTTRFFILYSCGSEVNECHIDKN